MRRPVPARAWPEAVRERLALALDVDDLVVATRLAHELRPYFGVAKIGLELYTASGPDAVGAMLDAGYEVFLDLKMHDIPTTVEKSARVAGAFGVSYLTLHAHGGVSMLRAGVEGLRSGAERAGLPAPVALAVTVLTSDDTAPPHIMPKRAGLAAEAGCGGIVCAAADLDEARHLVPRLRRVVPGVRPAGSSPDDQARVARPRDALDRGADLLVVGRPVTRAEDPVAAADALVRELTS
ncbi:MAG: orotidine-5'-phosphate decarboxylase [Acidimicrobiia bacterium]|nr:orotidine-5'-phosphate decarboxylase [Acidimicrobiia bacterium]